MHPWMRDWILLSKWKICLRNNTNCIVNNELFVTFDAGSTWKNIAEFVVDFDWFSEDITCTKKAGLKAGRLIYTVDSQSNIQLILEKMHQQIGSWVNGIHLYYSEDFMKTERLIISNVNKFIVHQHWIYVSKIDDYLNQRVSLWIGSADSKMPRLKKANLPTQKLIPSGFSILSDSKDSLILFVNHYSTDSPFGTILISDPSQKFSISKKNVVRNKDRIVEFQKINTLKGVFMTNTIDNDYIDQFGVFGIMNNFKLDSGHSDKSFSKRENLNYERYIKTLVSTDFGGIWEKPNYINDTSTDILDESNDFGNEYFLPDCTKDCELHFYVNSISVPSIKSHINAHGLVLANGNYGKYLESRSEMIHTFLSRDGGLNWSLVGRGSHLYEFSKYGDIIVMVPFDKTTEAIKFSLDYGKTWHYELVNTKIQFLAIRREESLEGLIFYFSGLINTNNGVKGHLITIDFQDYFNRTCIKTDEITSDFESWNPFSEKKCVLGEKTYFLRRKASSICLNKLDLSKSSLKQCCECTEEDWECDSGYERNQTSGSCQRIKSSVDFKGTPINSPPAICTKSYFITSGYRKIKDSKCEMGIYYGPIEIPCPGVSPYSIFTSEKGNPDNDVSEFKAGFKTLIIGVIAILLAIIMVKAKEKIFRSIEILKLKLGITNMESSKAFYDPIDMQSNHGDLI